MACKKAFLTSNHAIVRDKNFYLNILDKILRPLKTLVKLLKTESGYNLYDIRTNKILGCQKPVFELLNTFSNVLKHIIDIGTDCLFKKNRIRLPNIRCAFCFRLSCFLFNWDKNPGLVQYGLE